jgi:hypothetical protein
MMTRLILTTSDSGAGSLRQSGIADIVIPLGFQFIWGPLPSAGDLALVACPFCFVIPDSPRMQTDPESRDCKALKLRDSGFDALRAPE